MTHNPAVVDAFFKSYGIPVPMREHKFGAAIAYIDKAGRSRTRAWAFDYAWRGCTCNGHFHDGVSCGPGCMENAVVALEVEGGVWTGGRHTSGAGFVKDMEKYNAAAALGWRIIRVQPSHLLTKATADLIRSCLCLG